MKANTRQCIAAYDIISKAHTAAGRPMDKTNYQTTAGVFSGLRLMMEEDWFQDLPEEEEIQSGILTDYRWVKDDQVMEAKALLWDVYKDEVSR